MKAILISLLFLTLSISGQVYFPFPDSNGVWSVDKEKHLVKGDSIYNSITYKKYYRTTDTTLNQDSLKFVGLIRQDIANKKIFGIASTYTVEFLMYNFNLNVNDTLSVKPIYNFAWQTPRRIKVTAKDSILIDGQYRKRLTINSNVLFGPSMQETWIEGIGSSFGPLSPGLADPPVICICYVNCTLLCHKKNSSIIYINPLYNLCYKEICSSVGINEQSKNISSHIFPNPTSGFIFLDNLSSIKNITLINSQGQKLDNISFNFSTSTVDLSKINNGVYFLSITTSDKTVVQKIIVDKN